MAKVIIFGLNDFAELAHYYLCTDSEHEVVAFSVSEKYIPEIKEFKGLPIVSFEDVENIYPPGDYNFFAPMDAKKMNSLREDIYNKIKFKGYTCISYINSTSIISNGKIGENCFILENNILQPFTNIGNNVVMWAGNHIGHHGEVKDNVMFTSHVVMSGHCLIEAYSYLGVNSTIRNGVIIAEGTFVAMGSNIIHDTEPGAYIWATQEKKDRNRVKIHSENEINKKWIDIFC